MIKLNGIEVVPTIFPDKTSQIWKISEKVLEPSSAYIEWIFESEAEVFHLIQLKTLLAGKKFVGLYMPYLPYARQDKSIDNDSTFALGPFLVVLHILGFDEIKMFDAHNFEKVQLILPKAINIQPDEEINYALNSTKANVILFPDKGAYKRYFKLIEGTPAAVVVADKVRNQETGAIEKTELTAPIYKTDRVLIVDDLCDGGATFIKLMPLIKQASEVSLYVSHGIFSKGVQVLKDAGISRIFTKNGEVE